MESGRNDARALAAACAVATDQGLEFDRAAVIHSGSNVHVHLGPAPVLARVMTGTAMLHDDLQLWLQRELSVLRFLKPSGLAVRPSSSIDPGPYLRDGLWLTFCEWVGDHERADLSSGAEALGRALRDLHDALSRFGGELGDLLDVQRDIERLRRQLRPTDGVSQQELDRLRDRLFGLTAEVFAAPLPAQALHGDVSLSNLLVIDGRLLWNDFEDTFRGPVEWDVASLAVSLRARGAGPAFVARSLDAYGWAGERDLGAFAQAHDVYGEIWRLYVAQSKL